MVYVCFRPARHMNDVSVCAMRRLTRALGLPTQMDSNIAIGIRHARSAYADLGVDMRAKQRPGFGDGATKRAAPSGAFYVFWRTLTKRSVKPRARGFTWHLGPTRFGKLNLQGVQAR